jgi:hypothetical protein
LNARLATAQWQSMTRLALMCVMLAAMGAASAGSEMERPACNAQMRGRFWPERANEDAGYAKRSAQCGELWICTKGTWRHRWERLSIHISQLGGNARATAPGCEQFAGEGVRRAAEGRQPTAVE